MNQPVCFVIMPFGKKKYRRKNTIGDDLIDIDFDRVYKLLIEPAVIAAGMEPVRADNEKVGGIIHKPMFERIILSDYVVADLTGANANVFYELGIRHAVKPYTTVSIYASDSELPFDLRTVRTIPYNFPITDGSTASDSVKDQISGHLLDAKHDKTTDSPVYQLVDGIQFQNSLAHEKTDIFRDRVRYDKELKDKLADARSLPQDQRLGKINEIAASIIPENEVAGVLIDVMLSYRDLESYQLMVEFIEKMPIHVQQTVMVQEQYGFALNRLKNREKAIRVLNGVIEKNGPSSETCGILGRVFKDQFEDAHKKGNEAAGAGLLEKAKETYRKGFEADWRDAYPGVNLVTLLELQGNKEELTRVLPVVEYAVLQKIKRKTPDYWDYATLLELEVIRYNEGAAQQHLQQAAAVVQFTWMLDTTIKNLSLIRDYRKKRQETGDIAQKLIEALEEQKTLFKLETDS